MNRKSGRVAAAVLLAVVASFAVAAGGCESAPTRPGDASMGAPLFQQHCAACHALPDPAKYDRVEWRGILRKMGPRAGFDRQMQEDAFAWLESRCADISPR